MLITYNIIIIFMTNTIFLTKYYEIRIIIYLKIIVTYLINLYIFIMTITFLATIKYCFWIYIHLFIILLFH
jgi:hypothetical protein